jgi:hypothetical protein
MQHVVSLSEALNAMAVNRCMVVKSCVNEIDNAIKVKLVNLTKNDSKDGSKESVALLQAERLKLEERAERYKKTLNFILKSETFLQKAVPVKSKDKPAVVFEKHLERIKVLAAFLLQIQEIEYGMVARRESLKTIDDYVKKASERQLQYEADLAFKYFNSSLDNFHFFFHAHPHYRYYDAQTLLRLFLENERKLQIINDNIGMIAELAHKIRRDSNSGGSLITVRDVAHILTRPSITISCLPELARYVGSSPRDVGSSQNSLKHTLVDHVYFDRNGALQQLGGLSTPGLPTVLRLLQQFIVPLAGQDEIFNYANFDVRSLLMSSPFVMSPLPKDEQELFDSISEEAWKQYSLMPAGVELKVEDLKRLSDEIRAHETEQPKKKIKLGNTLN